MSDSSSQSGDGVRSFATADEMMAWAAANIGKVEHPSAHKPRPAILYPRRSPYDEKSGPSGTRAEEKALFWTAQAVYDALGYQRRRSFRVQSIESLRSALTRSLSSLLRKCDIPDDGKTLTARSGGEEQQTTRVLYPQSLSIPLTWYTHITAKAGRGKSRSERAYMPALNLLALIVYGYRRPGRFDGELMWLHQEVIRDRLRMSKTDYREALRYLDGEGYINRVVLRGVVPWDGRSKGVYHFAVPRLAKLRPVTRARKRNLGRP